MNKSKYPIYVTYKCFIDDDEGSDGCVFDGKDINDCDEARALHKRGESKCDCPYWREVEDHQQRIDDSQQRARVRESIKREAIQKRNERQVNQFKLDMQILSYSVTSEKPVYDVGYAGRYGMIAVKRSR